MSSSGVRLRPRHGRIAAFLAAASTTLVSFVGAVVADGLEGRTARSAGAALTSSSTATGTSTGTSTSTATGTSTSDSDGAAAAALATAPSTALRAALSVGLAAPRTSPGTSPPTPSPTPSPTASPTDVVGDVPEGSGTGRRVVFSESQQRVWLVEADEEVARTYLVSGSVFDNLDPGTYEVYSRSPTATGIDGSDLRYMVRFTQGENAAIGFHSIPRMDGRRMQTRAELGTPLSHGCIRQALPDARALWRFAPVGTAVVVTA